MGDPTSRRNQTRNRLRAQLRKKRESLADQFDFKIYIAFVFKEKVCRHNKRHLQSHLFVFHFYLTITASQWHKDVFVFFLFWSLQKKKSALFEVAEVVPVMTNNYEENILRGVRDSSYSLESSIELLQKDVVQLHAPRYQSMRRVRHLTSWSGCWSEKENLSPCLSIVHLSNVAGRDRLHTGNGFYPLATQRYWEDCLSAVLQMEGGRWWTL